MEGKDIHELAADQIEKCHIDDLEADDHLKLSKEKDNKFSKIEDEKNDAIVIDIPQEVTPDLNKCVIHRVPRLLRKVNEAAYTPQVVSIGPFHHGRKELEAMEFHKRKYYEEFCYKHVKNNGEDIDLKRFIKEHYDDIYASYAKGSATLLEKREVFEEIILTDACFIIELFLRWNDRCKDFILTSSWLFNAIMLDLLLLENQIPFFLLKKLYDYAGCSSESSTPAGQDLYSTTRHGGDDNNYSCLKILKELLCGGRKHRESNSEPLLSEENDIIETTNNHHHHPFLKLTCLIFSKYFCGMIEKDVFKDDELKHFTDLLRQSMFTKEWNDPNMEQVDVDKKSFHIYNATTLDKLGVKLKVLQEARLADLRTSPPILKYVPGFMSSMKLQLPKFDMDHSTERRLRNVMALEQCLYPSELYICNYISLLDHLINTKEDVELLVKKKIINNFLGSEEQVAELVNKLCYQIIIQEVKDNRYTTSCIQLNNYCDNRWLSAKATLERVYFKDLWTGSSTIVGIFVLIFSVSATIKSLFFS